MKKVLCLLVLAAFVAQILARPSDDPKPKPDEAKDQAAKAADEAKAKAPETSAAAEAPKRDSHLPNPLQAPTALIGEMIKMPLDIGIKAMESGSKMMSSFWG